MIQPEKIKCLVMFFWIHHIWNVTTKIKLFSPHLWRNERGNKRCCLFYPLEGDNRETFGIQINANNIKCNVKFTKEYMKEQLFYLDVMIKKIFHQIITHIYRKETDSKLYFLFSWRQLRYHKRNISFDLAEKIWTVVFDGNSRDLVFKSSEQR